MNTVFCLLPHYLTNLLLTAAQFHELEEKIPGLKDGMYKSPKDGKWKKVKSISRVPSTGNEEAEDAPEVGSELTVDRFEPGQKVDVAGKSKGKGFQGGVKRWNFAMQDATHGNSISHRAPGSIGQCQTPGRVWKGKKMAGHMGSANVTTQGLEVVRVDVERNLLLIKGAVPGAPGGDVIVRPAVKA